MWKFASCDGCQLSLLDCEDELLALAGAVRIAHFTEMSRATVAGPYDVSLVEGSITTPADAERIRSVRASSRRLITIGACATAGGIQALRNFAADGAYAGAVYAHPEYLATLDDLHADLGPRAGRRRAPGLPDRPAPAPGGAHRRVGRPPAGDPGPHGVPTVQGPGHRLPAGGRGDPVPGPGDPGRLRRPVPVDRTGLLRLLRAGRGGQHRVAGQAPGRRRPPGGRRGAPVRHLLRRATRPSAPRPSASACPAGAGPGKTRRRRDPRIGSAPLGGGRGSVAGGGRGLAARRGARRRGRRRRPSTSSSPRGSSRRCSVGRRFTEAPDITARICGICPVAYQTERLSRPWRTPAASMVDDRIAALRRLLYCGEWIQSHALHVYLLHAPDFLGCADAVELAERDRTPCERGLQLKTDGQPDHGDRRWSSRCTRSTCGSAASTARPTRPAIAALARAAAAGRDAALATVEWVAGFEFPDVEATTGSSPCATRTGTPSRPGGSASSDGLDLSPAEIRRAGRRGARGAFDRAARPPRGSRPVPHRSARPATRSTSTSLPAVGRRGGGASRARARVHQSVPQHRGAGRGAGVGLRRGAALVETYEPPDPPRRRRDAAGRRSDRCHRGPRGLLFHQYEHRRRRERSPRPGSCRRRRRTSSPSRPTCVAWSGAASTSTTRSSRGDASRRCAITTRASRVPPTSSTSTVVSSMSAGGEHHACVARDGGRAYRRDDGARAERVPARRGAGPLAAGACRGGSSHARRRALRRPPRPAGTMGRRRPGRRDRRRPLGGAEPGTVRVVD